MVPYQGKNFSFAKQHKNCIQFKISKLDKNAIKDIKFDSGVPKISTLLDQPLKLWISTNNKLKETQEENLGVKHLHACITSTSFVFANTHFPQVVVTFDGT